MKFKKVKRILGLSETCCSYYGFRDDMSLEEALSILELNRLEIQEHDVELYNQIAHRVHTVNDAQEFLKWIKEPYKIAGIMED